MRICVYAHSTTAWFFRALITACQEAGDDIEWSVIQPQWHFRDVIPVTVPPTSRCYLYENFDFRYRTGGQEQVQRALESGEGIVTALMKDKDGYRWLDKEDQLRRASVIHEVFQEFLERIQPDFVLFPDVETVDGFILLNLCSSLKLGVLYYTAMRLLPSGFLSENAYEMLPPYFGTYTEGDIVGAREELRKFYERKSRGPGACYPSQVPPKSSWFKRLIVAEYMRWRYERLHASEDSLYLRVARNLLPLVNASRRLRFDVAYKKYFDLISESDTVPGKYVFYALHYTPESSINGLEPYYVDQTRTIDALLLNLPKGHRLVVKEHPAMYGVRPGSFYRDLRRRPGLVLAHPSRDSRALIEGASFVATVTGTIGLESFLLGKPCLVFGRNFFAHLCYSAPVVRELRAFMERVLDTYRPPSETQKEIEIAKLLNIGADFLISEPWGCPSVMSRENVAAARAYLLQHLNRLRCCTPPIFSRPQ